jgi:hypothetical protein
MVNARSGDTFDGAANNLNALLQSSEKFLCKILLIDVAYSVSEQFVRPDGHHKNKIMIIINNWLIVLHAPMVE